MLTPKSPEPTALPLNSIGSAEGPMMEKGQWLEARELMERWGINRIDLVRYITQYGLPCRTISGKWLAKRLAALGEFVKDGSSSGFKINDFLPNFSPSLPDFPEGFTIDQIISHNKSKKAGEEFKAGYDLFNVACQNPLVLANPDDIMKHLYDLAFLKGDAVAFEKEHGLGQEQSEKGQRVVETEGRELQAPEEFIKQLNVWSENDVEINVKEPGKPTRKLTYSELGCRNEKTKEWTTLCEILQDKNRSFSTGLTHTKNWDQGQKLLKRINTKLRNAIQKAFNIRLSTKLYELDHSERPGTYRFKFQGKPNIEGDVENSPFHRYSDSNLLSAVSELSQRFKDDPYNNDIKDLLFEAATEARRRGKLGKDEFENMIQSHYSLEKQSKGDDENDTKFGRRKF